MRRRAPTLVGTGLLLCACVTTTSGLRVSGLPATTPRRSPRRAPEASVEAPISNDRRAVLLAGVVTLGAPLSLVAPARASPEFDAVRDELEGRGSGQLARIAALIDATDDAELVKLTREYNGYFRNTLLAAARKQLGEDDAAQGKALYNAVQEDLIAINKLARANEYARAREYYATLREDIAKFLALEPRS